MAEVRAGESNRKNSVMHVRLSHAEFAALETAAKAANMSVSGFIRSLAMEGAGVRPFLGDRDQAILDLLADGLRAVSTNLIQLARAINSGQLPARNHLTGTIKDAHAVALTVAAEISSMTQQTTARRGKGR